MVLVQLILEAALAPMRVQAGGRRMALVQVQD
jgi:hypothetical protein